MQVLSNAVYRSVEHRVLVSATDERLSMAFFYNPRSDLPLAPVPELVTPDRPALYQPMTFDEYRLFIRKRGPRGKSQVESLKTVEWRSGIYILSFSLLSIVLIHFTDLWAEGLSCITRYIYVYIYHPYIYHRTIIRMTYITHDSWIVLCILLRDIRICRCYKIFI